MNSSRVHPQFPTIEEVQNNPELAYSDHAEILLQIPLTQHGFSYDLDIISLNTLIPNNPSGLHVDRNWETQEQSIRRYERIANGLVRAALRNRVDIIALQETDIELMTPFLKEKLGSQWEIFADEKTSMITCYNKARYQLHSLDINHQSRIHSLRLTDKDSNKTIAFHNIWAKFDAFTYRLEAMLRDLLQRGDEDISIAAGDFNSRIADLDNIPRNIATTVVPVGSNEENGAAENVQITDYPDAGFCRDNTGIYQLKTNILDFQSGNIVVDNRTQDEVNPWPEYRMILCLDEKYQTEKLIDEKTIYEFEAEVQQKWSNNNVAVRVAADSYNNKAICVQLPLDMKDRGNKYNMIRHFVSEQEGFQFKYIVDERDRDKGFRQAPCIFAPLEKIQLLQNALFPDTLISKLIDDHINDLNKDKEKGIFTASSKKKINGWETLKQRVQEAVGKNKNYNEVIEEWEEDEAYVNNDGSHSNRELMGDHRNRFSSMFSDLTGGEESKSTKFLDRLKDKFGSYPILSTGDQQPAKRKKIFAEII